MLLIETLRNKPEIEKNGELIRDLTNPSVEFRGEMFVIGTAVIGRDLVMRPDLVAKEYFRNSNKFDYILKFSGVSNPFSIDEGDVLLIPSDEDMKIAFKPKTTKDPAASQKEVAKKFFDPNRLSKKDQKRLELLKQKSTQLDNGSKTNLPPNFAEPGSQEITVKDGKVIFGNDVVANKANCPDPLSKARAKQKLLEQKIFRNTK